MAANLYTIEEKNEDLMARDLNLYKWMELVNTQQETIDILKKDIEKLKLKNIAQRREMQELLSKGTAFAGKACPQIVSSFI